MTDKTLYEKAIELNLKIDHHETDLYIKDSPEARKLLETYEFKSNVTKFNSHLDGCIWWDVPFAYDPGWDRRSTNHSTNLTQ